ncbi:MAG: acyl-[acyl-carrier-protein]--UDP-N-acetylglucosamine O-acyltransferase [Elusimicrobia bacterium CG06_land_8_20_14_3_00_38_11]|nr:MAG: acyl-[acyl-carrier-protein]--UDP-N-acetylglucosamine O-acyltransferase [Elusimicrobia bacterium CG06_land_8_20_14_3_00_38_11]
MIHSTAIIDKSAEIEKDVEVGPYTVIGKNVCIKSGTKIGAFTVIEYAEIGKNCKIFSSAFIGTAPQDLKYQDEPTKIVIGNNCIIRECVTLNRGTSASRLTSIGDNCLFMSYSHVAHDCIVGNNVIMANCVTLAGHVEIGDFVVIGGLAAIHQFVRIGRFSMLGGGAMIVLDVPPFCQAQGDRAKLVGLNLVGIKRHGFTEKQISNIKSTYKTIFTSGITVAEAIDQLEAAGPSKEVIEFTTFIKNSKRGITRPGKITENNAE